MYNWEKETSQILFTDPDLGGFGQLVPSKDSKILVSADSKGNVSIVSIDQSFEASCT